MPKDIWGDEIILPIDHGIDDATLIRHAIMLIDSKHFTYSCIAISSITSSQRLTNSWNKYLLLHNVDLRNLTRHSRIRYMNKFIVDELTYKVYKKRKRFR